MGTIPTKLVEYVSVSINKLTGAIITELRSADSLRPLLFYDNQLTGTIPTELVGAASLSYID